MHALIFNVYMNRFANIKTDYNAINLFVVIRVLYFSACSRTDLHTVQHNGQEFSPSRSGSLSQCPGQTGTVESFCGFSSLQSGPLAVLYGPLLLGLPLKSQHSNSFWPFPKFIWCITRSMQIWSTCRHIFMMDCNYSLSQVK